MLTVPLTFVHRHKMVLLYVEVAILSLPGSQRHESVNDFRLAPIHHAGECSFRCGVDSGLVDIGHDYLFALSQLLPCFSEVLSHLLLNVSPTCWVTQVISKPPR